MNERYIHIMSIVLTLAGLAAVVFFYSTQPRSISEIAVKGTVVLGTYDIDKVEFAAGLQSFRNEEYTAARDAFARADPERRDANTQFYTAYSYYRQGWGRFSNDDALFQSSLKAVNDVIAIDPAYRSPDATLVIKTATELKEELEEGLKVTVSDFNPLKLTRERK